MQRSILARSSTLDLEALATVRTRLLGGDTSQDALLSLLITTASSAMAEYFGWPFARQTYQLKLSGNGRRYLCLPPTHCIVPLDLESVTATIDGEAVTDFVVTDPLYGELRRPLGWTCPSDDDAPLNVVLTWKAGWVLPGQIATWAQSSTFALGSWIRPTSPALSPLLFEVTTAGATDGDDTEPDWAAKTPGQTIAVGTATATARTAEELPRELSDLCYRQVHRLHSNLPPALSSIRADDVEASYFASQTGSALDPVVMGALDQKKLVAA